MSGRPHRGEIDFERLGAYFRVLGVATRLQLLQKLQRPQAAGEIHLTPFRRDRGRSVDRGISRQAVETHLRKLESIDFVRAHDATRDGRVVTQYVVNQARLFTFVDELRRLSLIRPPPGLGATGSRSLAGTVEDADQEAPAVIPAGPGLVLVSGPFESRAFPLRGEGPWVVGRSTSADAALDYDPFVSAANTEVWRSGERWFVRNLPASRNGTMLNWRLLAEGEHAPLVDGDTLAVGRSLMVARGLRAVDAPEAPTEIPTHK